MPDCINGWVKLRETENDRLKHYYEIYNKNCNILKCQNTKIADEPLIGLFCEDTEGVNQYSTPILSLKQKNFQIRGNPFYGGGKKYKNTRKKYKNTRKKYKNTRKRTTQ
jgi:hypothetical protein